MEDKLLLETNEYFTFFCHEKCGKRRFQIYVDDYGQCYVIAWEEEGQVRQWACASYGSYYYDMQDIAQYLNEKEGKHNIEYYLYKNERNEE